MNFLKYFLMLMILVAVSCSSGDPMEEIDTLISQKKYTEAKEKFQKVVDNGAGPAVERRYIEFLYERNLYRDFDKQIKHYLDAYPNDKEVRNLQFEYYAKLASAAEQQGNYQDAMFYIVAHLLSPDYRDYRKWENRQSTILRKWFESAAEKGNEADKKKAITQMINLSFGNLAKTLDIDLYNALSSEAAEQD